MCFLRRISQWLRRRCPRRNGGYSNEISAHHLGYCSGTGTFSGPRGHGSFTYDGEGSVTYSRRPSSCQPTPAPGTPSLTGGVRCSGDGSVVISSGDSGGTSWWGIAGGTGPAWGGRGGPGYSSEDSGTIINGSSGAAGGSSCHGGNVPVGGGYGYGDSPRDMGLTAAGGSAGAGCSAGGSGYGIYSGPEFSSGGGGCSQAMQQKCPVLLPNIKSQQSKQGNHWPPSQKKSLSQQLE